MKRTLVNMVAAIGVGILIGCAGGDTKRARVKEVPQAERIKAVAVEYYKAMWPRSPILEIMPVTFIDYTGNYSVWIWFKNAPGGFRIIQVSTNFEATGWRPGQ